MSTAPKPDGRRKAVAYRTRIRLVPCPPGHQKALDEGLELLAAIGRRARAARKS
ncbi:MAG TPA: hypothetical protein VFP15_13465 [Gemmatimonadaceae bacterium]|nr:hypothetical protein [Gemmatimonadaceae bacterium]